MGGLALHVGADWWTFLCTYEDHTPILDVHAGSSTVTFCISGTKADQAAVEFAQELASQAALFAAEVERLHALHLAASSGEEGGPSGNGEAA
jgi:outer membrane murein-binding lipoprotein Lpp